MRELQVKLKFATSYGTPLQADTIFGHFCWAIRYLEGEPALRELLQAFDSAPPVLISDGFAAVDGRFYLPKPDLPFTRSMANELAADLGIDPEDRRAYLGFAAALKAIEKKRYVESSIVRMLAENLSFLPLYEACFRLEICPLSMAARDPQVCKCVSWLDCPALSSKSSGEACAQAAAPAVSKQTTMHNVVGRITNSAVNLFSQEDWFANHGFHFLVRIDDDVFTERRLRNCLDYLSHSGFGRDASTGRGAITSLELVEAEPWEVPGANAFVSLSSAYVPRAGEFSVAKAWYSPHIKRGKLGGSYVLKYSPWKRPVLMVRAGAVVVADPSEPHGCLVADVHREVPEVVQYGYAYPLAAIVDEKAL